jgi:hypothetical protein
LSLLIKAPPQAEPLKLQIEAPPELAAVRGRLEAMPPGSFSDIGQFLGASEAGPSIHIVLATESSDLGHRVVPWISGFAVGESSLVVLFPARSPGYPDDTLEDVLRHEVAHVLIWRAAGGRHVPRWFDEGVAMEVERERRWRDQTQLFYQLLAGTETDLEHLDRLFSGGPSDQTRAYALAGAFVHNSLLREHGTAAVKEILMWVHDGSSFDTAFASVTGITPARAEEEFWRHQRIWTSWVPIVTSTTTLWLAITLLALAAIYMRHRRNRQIEEQWEKEGPDQDEYN